MQASRNGIGDGQKLAVRGPQLVNVRYRAFYDESGHSRLRKIGFAVASPEPPPPSWCIRSSSPLLSTLDVHALELPRDGNSTSGRQSMVGRAGLPVPTSTSAN